MASEPIVIGSDWYATLNGAQDSGTGDYLNTATVTAAVYSAAGAAVSGGGVTLTYVAASNGNYRGTLESTVTALLTAGAAYEVRYTLSQGNYDAKYSEWVTAQAPGAAIVDATAWQNSTGISVTGAELASVRVQCAAVAEALTRRCYPILIAPRTITMFAFDAPPLPDLYIPRPVRSVIAVYYHPCANGDSSLVDTTADLLVAGRDYTSRPDDVLTGWNRSGCLRRANQSAWGASYRRPVGRLGAVLESERGSVFVTANLGPPSVSPLVQEAACRAVTLLFQRRELGAPAQSQSWNGASFSLAGPFTADGAIATPEVTSLLLAAGVLPIHVG